MGEFPWWYWVRGHPQEKEQKTEDYLCDVPAGPVVFFHSYQAGVIICSKNVGRQLVPHPDAVTYVV